MSAYKNPIDASHYAECAGCLIKFRNRHRFRLIATIVLLICNFYCQTIFFAKQYSEYSSIRSVMMNNNGLSLSLGGGILSLLYMGAVIGGWAYMFKKNVKRNIQLIFWIVNGLFMAGVTIYQNISASHIAREGTAPHQLPFAYGILAIFFSVVCIVLAFLGEQKQPKLHIALIITTVIGALTTCYNWVIAGILLVMYLLAIPEFKKMQWIMQQPGYPYFSERFDEAQLHSEYEPLHKLDNRSYGEMEDLDGLTADPSVIARKEAEHKEEAVRVATPAMDYTLKQSDNPAEMPGIDEIFEHVEPQPEPELSKAEEIPGPKWDVPDVKADIPDTKWDVPDINTDIPDLPDIPDIPKL